jgi:hypothetical protein
VITTSESIAYDSDDDDCVYDDVLVLMTLPIVTALLMKTHEYIHVHCTMYITAIIIMIMTTLIAMKMSMFIIFPAKKLLIWRFALAKPSCLPSPHLKRSTIQGFCFGGVDGRGEGGQICEKVRTGAGRPNCLESCFFMWMEELYKTRPRQMFPALTHTHAGPSTCIFRAMGSSILHTVKNLGHSKGFV